MNNIEIPRRLNCCYKCKSSFSPGTLYHSTLAKSIRQDYCSPCWHDEEPPSSSCHWKGTIPTKKIIPPPPLTKQERFVELLKHTIEENSTEAHLLALYLVRKRILISRRDFTEGGCSYSLFEVTATEEMLPIKKVLFSPSELEKIKITLFDKLKALN